MTLTHLVVLAAPIASELLLGFAPEKEEGAGKAGCSARTHGPRATKKARGRNHRCGRSSGLPCAMVLTVSFALSPVTSSFLPPSPRGLNGFTRPVGPIETSARLDTSNGCQDHTTSPSATPFEKAGRRAWYQSRRSFSEG